MNEATKFPLKPCPFCGEATASWNVGVWWQVGCVNGDCEVQPHLVGWAGSDEDAAFWWNKRPGGTEMQRRNYPIYRGNVDDWSVTVDGEPLDLRLDLVAHSPTGFAWGYAGSGPAQLALAILAHHLNDDEQAVALHQPFKDQVIARLAAGAGFALPTSYLDGWVAGHALYPGHTARSRRAQEAPG